MKSSCHVIGAIQKKALENEISATYDTKQHSYPLYHPEPQSYALNMFKQFKEVFEQMIRPPPITTISTNPDRFNKLTPSTADKNEHWSPNALTDAS